jgi:hypothetical protein
MMNDIGLYSIIWYFSVLPIYNFIQWNIMYDTGLHNYYYLIALSMLTRNMTIINKRKSMNYFYSESSHEPAQRSGP